MSDILSAIGVADITKVTALIFAFIGVCAFFTSIVTEALKSIEKINSLPTKLVAYIVGLIITPLCYFALMAYFRQPIEWFMVFASFVAAFVVSRVSTSGWDDINELASRMFKK